MTKRDPLVRLYTGTEITCLALLGELEKEGITGIIRNEFQSAIGAGFGSGSPSSLDLYIAESSVNPALNILESFLKDNPI